MSFPKISIIVPVYKVEKYLRRCLDSIVAQTFTDWECILIDDGSPDNSGKICDEYAQKDGRFKVVHQENQGVSAARNMGLDEAKGEWIGFVDSDDWIDSEMYEVAYNQAIEVGADLIQWGMIMEKKYIHKVISHSEKIIFPIDVAEDYEPSMCSKLVSANLFKKNKIRYKENKKLSEDRLVSLQCYLAAQKCFSIGRCFYHYRVNPHSATHNVSKQMIYEEIEMVLEMENKCKNIPALNTFLFREKVECKIHAIALLSPPNFDMFRTVFSEINEDMERCDKRISVLLALRRYDFLSRIVLAAGKFFLI